MLARHTRSKRTAHWTTPCLRVCLCSSREQWYATHGAAYAARAQAQATARALNGSSSSSQLNGTSSFGGTAARPMSARTASTRDLMATALSVSSPRLVDPTDPHFTRPQTVVKRVTRQVEEPYWREVAVPIKTDQIVDVYVPRQVKTTGLTEVEALTERVDADGRKIAVPVRRYQPTEKWVTVQVPEQRLQKVDAVRVDQVRESRLVEVEEDHQYELQPVPTGRANVVNTRELPGTGRRIEGRTMGRTFDPRDPALANVGTDVYRSNGTPRSARGNGYSEQPASARFNEPQPNSARSQASSNGGNEYGQGFYAQQSPPPAFQPRPFSASSPPPNSRLGFKVRTSSTQSPGTCTVIDVDPSGAAARCGLRQGDVVLSANGQRVATMQDFKNCVSNSRGPLLMQVKRGADRMVVTLHR